MAIILAKGRARLSLGLPGPAPMVGWGGDGINAAQANYTASSWFHFVPFIPPPFLILRYGGISIMWIWLFAASRILFHKLG